MASSRSGRARLIASTFAMPAAVSIRMWMPMRPGSQPLRCSIWSSSVATNSTSEGEPTLGTSTVSSTWPRASTTSTTSR